MTNDDLTGGAAPPGQLGGPSKVRKMPGMAEELGTEQPDPGMDGQKSPRARAAAGERSNPVKSGADSMSESARPTEEEEALYAHKAEPEGRCRVCWSVLDLSSENPLAKQVCGPECARTAAVCLLMERIATSLETKKDKKAGRY